MSKEAPRVLRFTEVVNRTGLSRSSLYGRIRSGEFPRSVPLGTGRAVGFFEHEVDDWLARLALRRENETAAADAVLAIARARGRSYLRHSYLRFANEPQVEKAGGL